MFPPTLQLVFITGKYKYIVILMFDGPICVFVLSCYIIQLFHVSYASLAKSSMTFS